MKLHGLVYLIVGAILVGFSYYTTSVNEKLDIQKFMLFVWIGYVFIGIGLIKILMEILSKPRKPKLAKENFYHNQPMHNQTNSTQQHAHHVHGTEGQQNQQFIKFCSQCGSAVRHFDNFCYKCGSRMFHKK